MPKVTSRTYLLRVSVDLFKRNLWNTAWSMSSDNKNINIYIYNKNEKALKKDYKPNLIISLAIQWSKRARKTAPFFQNRFKALHYLNLASKPKLPSPNRGCKRHQHKDKNKSGSLSDSLLTRIVQPTSVVELSDGAKRVCLHHLSPGGHHIHTPCTDACASEALRSALTPLSPLLPPCSVCCCYPQPKREEGAVWHLRGRTGWVTYQLWCQAHMAGTSLARAITWEPVIDMRPHSQRLASPGGEGLAICHWAERENGIRRGWHKKKKRRIQAASLNLHLWGKLG